MDKTIAKIWGREIPPYETFYWGVSEGYFFGVIGGGISRTVKCDDSLAILTLEKEDMENEIKDTSSPKIAEPYISAVRGREPNVLTPRRTEYGKAVRREYERGELREPRTDGVSNTLTSVSKDNYLVEPMEEKHPKYRIRKLTPRECLRLMDVDDTDIDKIQGAGICNSQQYKLAGNSIVVNVLYHIFRKMFVEQGNEEQQLKLF